MTLNERALLLRYIYRALICNPTISFLIHIYSIYNIYPKWISLYSKYFGYLIREPDLAVTPFWKVVQLRYHNWGVLFFQIYLVLTPSPIHKEWLDYVGKTTLMCMQTNLQEVAMSTRDLTVMCGMKPACFTTEPRGNWHKQVNLNRICFLWRNLSMGRGPSMHMLLALQDVNLICKYKRLRMGMHKWHG